MNDLDKRLFVGIKISTKLQGELDKCPRGAEHYLKEDKPESLEIVTLGEDKLIGRFLQDGFPANDIDNVSRNIRSILTLIAQGHRLAEDSVRIYADSKVRIAPAA
ncbi:MAG: hypothetical protein A3F90_17470 [Deltaproteobacteria bacterium RIFCSPLOWO2_12_FULL_60_19]|jgi:UPF0288 family protein (methanogenesis marker protein 3)|nr:MAG: hypothetical protein A3F90_17470 [Deltaproteobacteria bacterium RIFCSPLOWO2_12_FULL_60_19]